MSTAVPTTPAIVTAQLFSDAKLQAAIDAAAEAVPADKKGALVAHVDLSGARLTFIERAGEHWSVRAGAFAPWHGQLSAEAEIVGSW